MRTNINNILLLLFFSLACCALEIQKGQTDLGKGVYSVSENVTFERAVTFAEGAVLDISKGVTVTFKQPISAGDYQIFSGEGDVRGLHKIIPQWFGAKADGKTDDTKAFQKALDSFPDAGFWYGCPRECNVLVLRGAYAVTSLISESSNLAIQSENAWLIAAEKGEHPYLIKFTKQFCSITGYLSVDGNYNIGYDCMINVNSRHFTVNNVIIWRAKLGWLFGNREWAEKPSPVNYELGDSENTLTGCATVHCLRGVELVGTETIVVFNNCLIYSYPWTLPENDPRKKEWESLDSTVVRCIGSLVYFTGCKICNFTPAWPIIEVQPLKNTNKQYYSKYGGAFLFNCHMEGGNFFAAVNPKKIPTQSWKGVPVEQQSISLSMISCGGYVSSNAVPINTDPMFTGSIVVQNCNFYTDILGGEAYKSSTFARIGNPAAPVKIDNLSLRNNYVNGLGAIEGGMVLFEDRMIFESRKPNFQKLSTQDLPVKFLSRTATTDTPHFANCYVSKTGEFKAPAGGLDNVRITIGLHFADKSLDSPVVVTFYKNDKAVSASSIVGEAGTASCAIPRVEAGEAISVKVRSMKGARAMVMDSELNYMQITASKY